MGRLWKSKWPVSWFVSSRLSTSSANNTGEIDLVLGTESASFQSKPSYVYPEGKKVFKEKAFFSTVTPLGRWIKLGTGFLLLLLFLCIVNLRSGWKRNFPTPELSHFSVSFDCGSTGTRIHVYEWSHKGKDQGNLPMLVHSRSGEPAENSGQLNGFPMMHIVQ
ncbi:hypothetical protein SUGI_0379240 [Cryptomeria japonica]|nr:hypothetical protein SUGI_0379240 [Cryptomeria japonica]